MVLTMQGVYVARCVLCSPVVAVLLWCGAHALAPGPYHATWRPRSPEDDDGVGCAQGEEGTSALLTQILDKFCPPGTTSSLDRVIPSSVMRKAKGIAMWVAAH